MNQSLYIVLLTMGLERGAWDWFNRWMLFQYFIKFFTGWENPPSAGDPFLLEKGVRVASSFRQVFWRNLKIEK